MSIRICGWLAIAVAGLGGMARGDDGGALVGSGAAGEVDALVAEALVHNPDLLAFEEVLAAARARPEQARSLPDPMAAVVYRNDGWSPTLGESIMTNLAFMGAQAFPWPGKRGLREAVAVRDALLLEEGRERARLSVVAAVRRAYWRLILARETLSVLREQEEVWREAEGVARARYAVGQGAQQDVLRAQVEITRFEQLRAEQEAEEESRRAELESLVGRPPDSPVVVTGRLDLRPEPRSLEAVLADALATSPELRATEVAAEREGLALDLAHKEFKPDFTVEAGYMNRGGLDPMWQAGVSFTLPFHRGRLHAGVAEAEARRRAATREGEAVRSRLRFRTRERFSRLSATATRARLYEEGLIPQAELAYEAALANYQAGRVPFLTVLEALSTLYVDRVAHLSLLAAIEEIKASLDEASLEASPSMGGPGMPDRWSASPRAMGMAGRDQSRAPAAMGN